MSNLDRDNVHSCSFCYVQEVDPSLGRVRKRDSVETDLSSGTVIRYRGSRVLDGASNGCVFFKDILGLLESILMENGNIEGIKSPCFRPDYWIYDLFFSDYTGHLETAVGSWRCVKGEIAGDTQHPRQQTARFLVLAYQGNPAAESIPIRPFLHNFRGEESTLWAKKRISDCENKTSHPYCTTADPSFLPSRLLRIKTSSDGSVMSVQLHQMPSSGVEITGVRYATLSYCWGGPQTIMGLSKLMAGIPASALPKTLHDAIEVTWNLGLEWIWIDSLCICQDNPEEKVVEVGQMHLIYHNSFITLSATRASQCSQGFLHRDSLPRQGAVGYTLPFASPSGRLGSVILSRTDETSPIDYRAWTFQEHILARRVLRFTDYQLHWSCGSISKFETDDTGTLPSLHVQKLERGYEMYRALRDEQRDCRQWMNIVEEYTCRELTDGLDKLPAMSGIAEFWAQATEDHYLAGLWESHLPLGLLWTSAQPFRQHECQAYRAPSWSWASITGQIDWFDYLFSTVDPAIKLQSCSTKCASLQAPYGAVQSGALSIHGLLQETVLDMAITPVELVKGVEYLDLESASIHLDFWDEILASKIENAKLYCLQICCFDENTGRGPTGLILATKKEEEYTRVGVFTFEPPQEDEVQELGNFQALLDLSSDRQTIQRSAFQNITARTITIF